MLEKIKSFVINLASRSDRYKSFLKDVKKIKSDSVELDLERFEAVNGMQYDHTRLLSEGMDTYRTWRDPYWNRKLTKGEIGCLLSHVQLWEKCVDLNEPILIFEDDIKFLPSFNLDRVVKTLDMAEFVYLSRREIGGRPVLVDVDLAIPSYSYWTCAYAVTPSGASKLCNSILQKNLFTVDEYIPVMYGDHPNEKLRECFRDAVKVKALAFEPSICEPLGVDSDIENNPVIFMDFKTHVFTVATELDKAKKLIHSCQKNDVELNVLGSDWEWTGGDMTAGPGGGMKVNLLKPIIQQIDDNDVVMFLDGYDVFVNENISVIINRYLDFRAKVVFAAEKVCWPDERLASLFPEVDGYKYLNSGCFIGVASELKRILEEPIKDSDDDQYYYQTKYLSGRYDMKLDSEGYLFQCLGAGGNAIMINEFKQLSNVETNCTGCIAHGNGGPEIKKQFEQLYAVVFGGPEKNKLIGLRK